MHRHVTVPVGRILIERKLKPVRRCRLRIREWMRTNPYSAKEVYDAHNQAKLAND
jgi:hypothetical protein